jgi:transcription initiation factor TFIIIB Brf1 subunit/transcription initiation factor TFIIB
LLEAVGLFVPSYAASAQQMPAKPEVKISEAKLLIMKYVDKMSRAAKNDLGIKLSEAQKIEMVEALADELGRVDAIAKAAEAELKALKDEFKARGLDCAEGLISTVTAAEVFKNALDTARVREALGDHVKQFETLIISTVIRIKPTRRLEALAA